MPVFHYCSTQFHLGESVWMKTDSCIELSTQELNCLSFNKYTLFILRQKENNSLNEASKNVIGFLKEDKKRPASILIHYALIVLSVLSEMTMCY